MTVFLLLGTGYIRPDSTSAFSLSLLCGPNLWAHGLYEPNHWDPGLQSMRRFTFLSGSNSVDIVLGNVLENFLTGVNFSLTSKDAIMIASSSSSL